MQGFDDIDEDNLIDIEAIYFDKNGILDQSKQQQINALLRQDAKSHMAWD